MSIYGSNSNRETTNLKKIMSNFTCDLEPDDEVIHAIQTILNAISCKIFVFMLFHMKKSNE